MTIWVVTDGDHNGDWIVAAYDSKALAIDHVERTGEGWVEAVEVLTVLPDRVASIDPDLARATRDKALAEQRAKYESEQALQRRSDERIEAMTIGDRALLCRCQTFTSSPGFVTKNGYCRFCGGWTPNVYRSKFGDDGLARAIELLAYDDRVKMYQLTGLVHKDST